MPVGSAVRRALGRLEPLATRLYRNAFIDLDSLAATLRSIAPDTKRVLEIGCGDGDMATALNMVLPDAELLGIDPAHAEPGRMYAGDASRASFRPLTASQLADQR